MIPVAHVIDQDVLIRAASEADLAALGELDAEVFGELAYPPFVLRQWFDLYQGWWLVAQHADGLRGYSLGVPLFDRSLGWLLGLGVRQEFWRRGYGRSLTVNSMRLLEGVGVREVRLTVEPGNRAAITLYRELGFVVDRMVKDYLGPGHDRLLMIAALR
ncbi:GNAT family N-acetyltransferase [Kibdelosporangium philippinense]|uniref:GNAT family N-acetyltransferase n=1 Tax=Kibdelosporangium philippinense TaxID=211113 RepID=A0ABS8ZTX2_9PSEU|nr:GNAT family N-acetyltransferase [Kibdelosporangium philippinense]MCE7011034.1 GNAT family N-acetyltransferase [Kibdelosporangium philippinense]